MSKTLSDTLPLPPRHGPVLPRRTVLRRLLKWTVLLLAGIWLADTGISLVIQYSSVKRKLTAHLETAFGRQVEVGRYSFSLWGGPALEAQSITVAEDARFGHEYFLRAESLRVELSWQRLLLGHVELGALSLTRPSLNLVRNGDGIWNLAEWLPRPAEGHALPSGVGPVRPTAEIRFRKINIDRGRINFKQGDTKLPFAFTDVEGTVEAEGSGSWRVDLEASPLRAAVPVQQAGTLHLTGHVGGTSSRLRPAALVLSWSEASITDVLRLVRSYDYGVFGTVSLSITAETQGDAWVVLQGRAELRQLHRWDLPMRPDNPELNVLAKLQWDPSLPVLYVTEAALEAPHSRAQASGGFCWGSHDFM